MQLSMALMGTTLVVVALLFGGGTRPGFLGDGIVQLFSIFVLAIVFSSLSFRSGLPGDRLRVGYIGAAGLIAALPLAQILPLPPSFWTRLPTHSSVVEGLALAGVSEAGWWSWSIAPTQTVQALFSTLPFAAIFIVITHLDSSRRRFVSLAILAVGIISVFLGLVQIAQGPSSELRFFETTNPSEAVGFFANRNHFAALLYVILIFAAAWLVEPMTRSKGEGFLKVDAVSLVLTAGLFLIMFLAVSGQLMARSRAGIVLTMIALVGAYAIVSMPGQERGQASGRIVLAAIALSLIVATQFALYRVLDRFDTDQLADSRLIIGPNTIRGAKAALPLGTGIGTFVTAYSEFERPQDTSESYINRAHNDLLEMCLESGVVGVALLVAMLVWFAYRAFQIWRPQSKDAEPVDIGLMRGSTLVVLLLLLHSLVDYPLRTAAMSAVFAAACGLMTYPVPRRLPKVATPKASASSRRFASHEQHSMKAESSLAPANRADRQKSSADQNDARAAGGDHLKHGHQSQFRRDSSARWGKNIEWPEEWKKSSQQAGSKTDDK